MLVKKKKIDSDNQYILPHVHVHFSTPGQVAGLQTQLVPQPHLSATGTLFPHLHAAIREIRKIDLKLVLH